MGAMAPVAVRPGLMAAAVITRDDQDSHAPGMSVVRFMPVWAPKRLPDNGRVIVKSVI
jgi:hypothetical protein